MTVNMGRRELLKLTGVFAVALAAGRHAQLLADDGFTGLAPPPAGPAGAAQAGANNAWAIGGQPNFQAIYGNPELRAAFLDFLRNVFHLYPEDDLHALIAEASRDGANDAVVYQRVREGLPRIKPLLSELRYAVPALRKQKKEMTRQTLDLLGATSRVNGYLELGTTGRYVDKLKDEVEIHGDIVLVHTDAPTYSPVDLVERGQPFKIGRFVPMRDYDPVAATDVADGSLDLVANFIGFHHAPLSKRDAFVRSLHRALRAGGRLVLRDHDVDSPAMNRMVALAHDVFNLGTQVDWGVNQTEIRNFTSQPEMVDYLDRMGFQYSGRALRQNGDPTQNELMEFRKA